MMRDTCILREINALAALNLREYGSKCPYRRNLKIVRTLVCRSNFVYKMVWEKETNKHIACERNRIYFNNFRECYAGYGKNLEPKLCYRIPIVPHRGKIEDALVFQIPMEILDDESLESASVEKWEMKSSKAQFQKNSLFGLTHNNWLVRFDLQNGRVLEEVHISNKYSFRNMSWETEGHTIVVKSTQPGRGDVFALAVFDVHPLKFVTLLEIPKSVFGRRMTGVTLSQGILITMHSSGLVKMYSFTDIHRKHKLAHHASASVDRICGNQLTIQLTEEPPVLFELKCADHLIEIGGTPWHYMYSPPNQEGIFFVTHLETDKQAVNGILDFESSSIEPHRAIFHSDESGRIIHIGNSELRVLKICQSAENSFSLEDCFTIHLMKKEKTNWSDFPLVSKSGRLIKKRVSLDGFLDSHSMNIEEVDYENELDVLCVTSAHYSCEGKRAEVFTRFYDNLTGKLLKETALDHPWQSFYELSVTVDLDTIIQTIKPKLGLFRCVVYRLTRCDPD